MKTVQTFAEVVREYASKHGVDPAVTERRLKQVAARSACKKPPLDQRVPEFLRDVCREDQEEYPVPLPALVVDLPGASSRFVYVAACTVNGVKTVDLRVVSTEFFDDCGGGGDEEEETEEDACDCACDEEEDNEDVYSQAS